MPPSFLIGPPCPARQASILPPPEHQPATTVMCIGDAKVAKALSIGFGWCSGMEAQLSKPGVVIAVHDSGTVLVLSHGGRTFAWHPSCWQVVTNDLSGDDATRLSVKLPSCVEDMPEPFFRRLEDMSYKELARVIGFLASAAQLTTSQISDAEARNYIKRGGTVVVLRCRQKGEDHFSRLEVRVCVRACQRARVCASVVGVATGRCGCVGNACALRLALRENRFEWIACLPGRCTAAPSATPSASPAVQLYLASSFFWRRSLFCFHSSCVVRLLWLVSCVSCSAICRVARVLLLVPFFLCLFLFRRSSCCKYSSLSAFFLRLFFSLSCVWCRSRCRRSTQTRFGWTASLAHACTAPSWWAMLLRPRRLRSKTPKTCSGSRTDSRSC
jgi:hypothetical protein